MNMPTRIGTVVVFALALTYGGPLTTRMIPPRLSAERSPMTTPYATAAPEDLTRTTRPAERSAVARTGSTNLRASAIPNPSIHLPPSPSNWVVVKTTSAQVTEITSPFYVWGRRTGEGPLVFGVGLSSKGGPYPFSWISVERYSGGPPSVALTAGPVRRSMPVLTYTGPTTFEFTPIAVQQETKLVAILIFVVNGVIDGVHWEPTGSGLTTSVRWGTGSTALEVAAPATGAGVAVTGAGAGAGSYTTTVRQGIAGAVEWLSCQYCVGTWTPPGGASRVWFNVRHKAWPVCWCGSAVGFGSEFAGEAGRWRWAWAAVSYTDDAVLEDGVNMLLSEPVLAAYAPIGPDWVLFKPCSELGRECLGV